MYRNPHRLSRVGSSEKWRFLRLFNQNCPKALTFGGRLAIVRPMPILKIARMGHPILGQVALPVENPTGRRIKGLVRNMVETMRDARGAGLAAPQIHVGRRVIVFQAPPERATAELGEAEVFDHTAPLTVLINPEIEFLSDEIEEGWEGCLSVPGLTGLVPRCAHIRYCGIGMEGEEIEREARGFHARVVQHEFDHLDGILYPQRMTDLSKLIFESETRHFVDEVEDEVANEAENGDELKTNT